MEIKSSKQLERHFKGAANHYRIAILILLKRRPGCTLEEIADILNGNIKTLSGHTGKLVAAGLVNKKYQGREVLHSLSPYGEKLDRKTHV